MTDLEGRKALVTGGGTGLGRSMCVKLAERGASVIVNYARSAAEAEETVALCRAAGVEAKAVQADVADPEGCRKLAEAAAPWGRLDILMNNAGITKHAPDHGDLDALTAEDFQNVYAVNVVGAFLALQALKPLLAAGTRPAAGRAPWSTPPPSRASRGSAPRWPTRPPRARSTP